MKKVKVKKVKVKRPRATRSVSVINLRIDPGLKEKIAQLANDHHVSINYMIEHTMRAYVDRQESLRS
jgi:predicted HicB family RNase H-like nuclease